ncbi:MAG: DNA polymerase III subunit delta [Candidatus Buchananbacteria bacterium]|nr:DNA polymerase III subunit delta [Candidatus Buchananbacteria bacterium]
MIIFLHGPDTFRSRQKLTEIKEKFIREVDKSALNVETLDGQNLDTKEFQRAITAQPFLATKRLIIIENLIGKNKGQKIQKEILEILNQNNLDSTVLLFWEGELNKKPKKSRAKTTARRSQLLFDKLIAEKFAQEFSLLKPDQVKSWAGEEIKKRGGQIDFNALELLANLVGDDLWQLNSEIDKLVALANQRKIDQAMVKLLVKSKINDDVFGLTDALGQKNQAKALKIINDQIKKGADPLELLSLIIWQFRNLLLVKSFMVENGSGYPDQRLAYQLKIHPFVLKKILGQVNRYDYQNLKNNYQKLLKIDYQIKTSQINPEVLFDLLVVEN